MRQTVKEIGFVKDNKDVERKYMIVEDNGELILYFVNTPCEYKVKDIINNHYPFDRDFCIHNGWNLIIKKEDINNILSKYLEAKS